MSSSGTVFDLIFKHFNFKGKVQKKFSAKSLKNKRYIGANLPNLNCSI